MFLDRQSEVSQSTEQIQQLEETISQLTTDIDQTKRGLYFYIFYLIDFELELEGLKQQTDFKEHQLSALVERYNTFLGIKFKKANDPTTGPMLRISFTISDDPMSNQECFISITPNHPFESLIFCSFRH